MTLTEAIPATLLAPESPPLVVARDLTRVWGKGSGASVAVDEVDLTVGTGEILAVVGPSGSGKSTLGALIAGIDRPTAGSIIAAGDRIDALDDRALARWRADHVGVVFQQFHLLPTLTAAENVALALELKGVRRGRRRRVDAALADVGLADHRNRLPSQLSGGQQQRVAIARAAVVEPDLLVADEPTGSLDRTSGEVVFDRLLGMRDRGTSVVFITHDPDLASAADRVVEMVDGRIATEVRS